MKRRVSDTILNAITFIASSISVVILAIIIFFIFSKGISKLSWQMIISDNHSENHLANVVDVRSGNFTRPSGLSDDVFYSTKWGIGVVDYKSQENKEYILVEVIDEKSPLKNLVNSDNNVLNLSTGSALARVTYKDSKGSIEFAGSQTLQNAESFVKSIDSAESIDSIYYQTLGGGIRGSLFATLWLILLSLVFSLPIGIASAIYLTDYAKKNKFTKMLKSSIETLSGVPSIVFGLMGVAVFYPITTFFGADGLSILLGAMTMAVVLLPTIIRSTQEALIVIPRPLKDGSLALGANLSQTIFKVILPCAMPGILTGILLSVGRIIGESAALIYTMGVFVNDKPEVLKAGSSLAVHIWGIMSGEQPNFQLAAAISIVILVTVFALNIIVKIISKKISKAWY